MSPLVRGPLPSPPLYPYVGSRPTTLGDLKTINTCVVIVNHTLLRFSVLVTEGSVDTGVEGLTDSLLVRGDIETRTEL